MPAGTHQLIVSNPNGPGAPVDVVVSTANAPAVFVAPSGALVFRIKDGAQITTANPASVGDALRVYLTGMGQTSPALGAGQLTPFGEAFTPNPLTAKVGNVDANVTSSSAVPGFGGLYQVNFTVPGGVPAGIAKLQLKMQGPALAIFGAPDYSAAAAVDLPIK